MTDKGLFRSLRRHNFRLWAAGALVSNIGTGMQYAAQSWLVLTVLTQHSAAAVGLVMALQFAPQLLLLPWTGSTADQSDQRRLLMITQVSMGALALILGVLTLSGAVQLWQVCLFAFLFGSASAFDSPVRQVFVSQLVGDEDLPNAVSLNAMSFNAGSMIGPAIAGLMIGVVGTGWAFVLNGASFGAMLAALFLLRTDELHPSARAKKTPGSFVEGLRYVSGRPDIVAILGMLFLIGLFPMNAAIFISTMSVKVFHVDAVGFGFLSSLMAAGTLLGSLLSAHRARTNFKSLLLSTMLLGGGFTLAGIAPSYWGFGSGMFVVGMGTLMFLTATNGLMQLTTEAAMRGRVMALRIGVGLGATPFGAPVLGWMGDNVGPRWTLAAGALASFAAAAIAFRFLRRRPEGSPAK